MHALLSTSIYCTIRSAPIVCVNVKCFQLVTVCVSIALPRVSHNYYHLHLIRHTLFPLV